MELAVTMQVQVTKLSVTDSRSILQHRLEHWLQFTGRSGDDLEHLAGRGLLLQRFGQIVSALAQLVEQPRILDRDDSLSGEVADELDLLIRECQRHCSVCA